MTYIFNLQGYIIRGPSRFVLKGVDSVDFTKRCIIAVNKFFMGEFNIKV